MSHDHEVSLQSIHFTTSNIHQSVKILPCNPQNVCPLYDKYQIEAPVIEDVPHAADI